MVGGKNGQLPELVTDGVSTTTPDWKLVCNALCRTGNYYILLELGFYDNLFNL